jgi:hypothetical protein
MIHAINRPFAGLLSLALAALWVGPKPGHAAPVDQPLLGLSLADAQTTDFFVFFHLNETSRERDVAKRVVVNFKPESSAFRKVVTVRTTLDAQGRIVQIELLLARSFVRERVYSGDIAKSVLVDSLPVSDRAAIMPLAAQIRSTYGTDSMSDGYEAYLGRRKSFTQELSSSSLAIESLDRLGEPWVRIQVALKP